MFSRYVRAGGCTAYAECLEITRLPKVWEATAGWLFL